MPSTLDACEKYFGTKDLYQIFSLDKNATVAESKNCVVVINDILY